MSFWMSLILYNPLEAFIILMFVECVLLEGKIENLFNKDYMAKIFKLSTLNFLVQHPMVLIEGTIWYAPYNCVLGFVIIPFLICIVSREIDIKEAYLSMLFYVTTFNLSIQELNLLDVNFEECFKLFLANEMLRNLIVRSNQLFMIIGVLFMKKTLKKMAKNSFGGNASPTLFSTGPVKMSNCMKQEAKNA